MFRHTRSHALLCFTAILAIGLIVSSTSATPAASPQGRSVAARGVMPERPGCASCHMLNGAGQPDVGIPRLVGLSAAYILDQLSFFASGQRINPAMAPYAKMLSAAQRRQVAAYFASLPVPAPRDPPSFPDATIAAGGRLFLNGNFQTGLLACANCHGQTGQGVGDFSPRLAGQSAAYVAEQLSAWKAGNLRDPKGAFMHAEAGHLTKTDIAALAAYVGCLKSGEEARP